MELTQQQTSIIKSILKTHDAYRIIQDVGLLMDKVDIADGRWRGAKRFILDFYLQLEEALKREIPDDDERREAILFVSGSED
jgi:hypothetical protein